MIENIPEKYKSSVGYVNYKKTLIASLESLLNREKEKDFENVNIVFKLFQFKKNMNLIMNAKLEKIIIIFIP